MGEKARVRLIRAAQSDELRATFRQLAEIDGPNGPKYPRRVLLELAARVVGRVYEPMLLELCHLVRAAQLTAEAPPGARHSAGGGAGGAGFEWIFWGVEEARPGAFRAAFVGACGSFDGTARSPAVRDRVDEDGFGPGATGDALHVGEDAVTLAYPEGRFEVHYGRMAILAAMMEFVVSTVGYRALVDALGPLAAPAVDRDAVAGAARDLARRLYEWLGDHLPAAQAQRKFHAMIAFLEETLGADFTVAGIDDEAILRFWLRNVAPAEGVTASGGMRAGADFRGYRNTFLAFLALARVLVEGAELGRFEERHTPIGPDFEAGEIDPAAEFAATPEGAAEIDSLARLEEEPAAAVKALNRRETALLKLPVGESDAVRRLPRSYLRAECFGPVQNRLSQALRRKAGAAELAAVIAAGPNPGYRARIEALGKADAHVRRVAKACLYVLHRMGAERGGHEGRRAGNRDGGGAAPALDFRLLGEARKAFDGLSRAGFERSAPNDPALAPAYGALADALPGVSERLGTVLRTLGPPDSWEAAEAEDRPVFSRAFARLYGAGTNDPSSEADDDTRVEARGREDAVRDGGRSRAPRARNESPVRPAGGRP